MVGDEQGGPGHSLQYRTSGKAGFLVLWEAKIGARCYASGIKRDESGRDFASPSPAFGSPWPARPPPLPAILWGARVGGDSGPGSLKCRGLTCGAVGHRRPTNEWFAFRFVE